MRSTVIVLIRASGPRSARRTPPRLDAVLATAVRLCRIHLRFELRPMRERGAAYSGLGGLVKLIDRSQVLVGEVRASGHEALENRVQQWRRGLGACLNLAYEL